MRLLLDTNVLLSALWTSGSERALLGLVLQHHTLLISERILAEFEAVARRRGRVPREESQALVDIVRRHGLLTGAPASILVVVRDRRDAHVLQASLAGSAHYLVTGDRDLLHLKAVGEIPIVRPADALRILGVRPTKPF